MSPIKDLFKKSFASGGAFALGAFAVFGAISIAYAAWTSITASFSPSSSLTATTMNQIVDNINFLNDKVNALGTGGGCYWDNSGTCASGFTSTKTASYGYCIVVINGNELITARLPGASCGPVRYTPETYLTSYGYWADGDESPFFGLGSVGISFGNTAYSLNIGQAALCCK